MTLFATYSVYPVTHKNDPNFNIIQIKVTKK